MKRIARTIAVLAIASLVAVGCGDDKDEGKGSTTTAKRAANGSTTVAVATTSTVGTRACPGGTGDITVLRMADNRFEPDCLTVSETQALRVSNTGKATHNFTVGKLNVDLKPEDDKNFNALKFEGFKPGEYEFFCKFHKGQGMKGTLVVVK